jgi:hypothetical protein
MENKVFFGRLLLGVTLLLGSTVSTPAMAGGDENWKELNRQAVQMYMNNQAVAQQMAQDQLMLQQQQAATAAQVSAYNAQQQAYINSRPTHHRYNNSHASRFDRNQKYNRNNYRNNYGSRKHQQDRVYLDQRIDWSDPYNRSY